ncbi:MAG: HAMP domain-containing protein [bacterium]|nr:HAMP domain-containing protein [bacterium]
MKISNKISLSFLAFFFLFLMFFIVGSYTLSVVSDKFSDIIPLNNQNVILQEQISRISLFESEFNAYIVIGSKELKAAIKDYSEESSQEIYTLVNDEKKKEEFKMAFLELGGNINFLIEINEQSENKPVLNNQILKVYESIDKLRVLENKLLDYKTNELQNIIKEQKDIIAKIIKLFLFFCVSILVIGFFLILFLRKTVVPITNLRNAAINIGKGDLDIKIAVEASDEVGELASAFNEMVIKLKGSYLILEQKVKERTKDLETERGSLEKKVKERTADLEKLKEGLEETVAKRSEELNKKLTELERVNKLMVGRELKMVELKKENEELKKE